MNNEKIQFGPFELDPKAGELRRGHRRVRLQERPLKMLVALLANPGEVVTREELRMRLWPAKVFVDFDNGLNNAVNKLRTALGDSAAKPEYIETVGRRGYRFIGSVAEAETPPAGSSPPPMDEAEGASAIQGQRDTDVGVGTRARRERDHRRHCAEERGPRADIDTARSRADRHLWAAEYAAARRRDRAPNPRARAPRPRRHVRARSMRSSAASSSATRR